MNMIVFMDTNIEKCCLLVLCFDCCALFHEYWIGFEYRHSVGKHASKSRELRGSDFEPREKYWTRFPPEGSKHTHPHHSIDFKWKDYCPMVFR